MICVWQEWTDSRPSYQVGSIAAPPLIMKKKKNNKKCLQHALQEDSFAPSSPTIFATPPFFQVCMFTLCPIPVVTLCWQAAIPLRTDAALFRLKT